MITLTGAMDAECIARLICEMAAASHASVHDLGVGAGAVKVATDAQRLDLIEIVGFGMAKITRTGLLTARTSNPVYEVRKLVRIVEMLATIPDLELSLTL